MARVYDAGTPMQLAHVLFAIDRQARPARMYYIDTPRYQLHVRFLRDTRLVPSTAKRRSTATTSCPTAASCSAR